MSTDDLVKMSQMQRGVLMALYNLAACEPNPEAGESALPTRLASFKAISEATFAKNTTRLNKIISFLIESGWVYSTQAYDNTWFGLTVEGDQFLSYCFQRAIDLHCLSTRKMF